MSHVHTHLEVPPRTRAGVRHKRRLLVCFGLALVLLVVEAVAGFFTHSLALLSDAGHMLTDVLGLGMALAAIHLASSGAENPQRTFGLYRLEILAALANGVLLFGVAIYVFIEAFRRLFEPADVLSFPMLVVAVIGLLVNLTSFALLRQGAKESLNVRGAYLEVIADAVGSAGVIAAAIVLETTGWSYIDSIVAAAIGLFILPRTIRLTAQAVRILIQAAPPEIELASVESDLSELVGVADVHDLHVWTLTSDMEVASAHLRLAGGADPSDVLVRAQQLLRDRYSVVHATLQVESDDRGCTQLEW